MSLFTKLLKRARLGAASPAAARPTIATPKGFGRPPMMDQPMNLIQVPDLTRKLVTRYGLREKAPAPTLASEIVPVVLVDDLIGESDLIRPRIRPASGSLSIATAAQQALFGVINPAGSRVILHVYYLVLAGSVIGSYDLHFSGTPGVGLTGIAGFRNGLFPAQAPAGNVFGNATGVSPGGVIIGKARHAGSQNAVYPFEAIIDEGQGLQFRQNLASTGTFDCTAVWTEEDKS